MARERGSETSLPSQFCNFQKVFFNCNDDEKAVKFMLRSGIKIIKQTEEKRTGVSGFTA